MILFFKFIFKLILNLFYIHIALSIIQYSFIYHCGPVISTDSRSTVGGHVCVWLVCVEFPVGKDQW